MGKDTYIKQLETENAELKQRITMLENRIEQLERRLGTNSRKRALMIS
jgi:cell division protein FtsB